MIVGPVILLAAADGLAAGQLDGGAKTASPRALGDRSLFLDRFQSQLKVTIAATPVKWVSAIGEHRGLLFRPETGEQLPALVLIANEQAREFYQQSARDLSSIGYVVLLVENGLRNHTPREIVRLRQDDERERETALAKLGAAVRWLQRRADVFPEKLGVLGWATGTHRALELAAAERLQ